jgi:hypothetical protein
MFDPYRKWLGIPEGKRPPTHYQLLGISPDERDPEVINAAVVRQSAYVRNFQAGKYSAEATRLLNEIAAAKVCLLDPQKRTRYDAELRPDEPSSPKASSTSANPRPVRPAPAARPVVAPPNKQPMLSADAGLLVSQAAAWAAPVATAPVIAPAASLGSPVLMGPSRAPSRGVPPAVWIGCALLGCSVLVALLIAAFGGSRDAGALAGVDRPDPSGEPVLIASGPYVPQRSENREPVAPPVIAPAEPPSVGPLSTREPFATTFPQPSLEPGATADPGTADPKGTDVEKPKSSLPPGLPDPSDPASIDQFFDRFKKEAKGRQEAQKRLRAPGFGRDDKPEGSWPVLDGSPREPSRIEKRAKERLRAKIVRSRQKFIRPSADLGRDTVLVGERTGGGPQRIATVVGYLVGLECEPGEFREVCIGQLLPIFSFERKGDYTYGAIAREGYAVGAVKVRSQTYINGLQLIFMRIKDNGSLDTEDSYTSEWIGYSDMGKEYTLSGDGAPVIGIHKRQGLVVGALALVVDDTKPADR